MSHADSVALLQAFSVFLDYPVSLDTIEIDLDSAKAVQMYQKFQLLTMMSADPDIIKTAWSRIERKRYPCYDLAMAPPADSLFYKLYREQRGKLKACTFQGDYYVIEMEYPRGDSTFIERRPIIPEVDVGMISPRLASQLLVMTIKHETYTYPFKHGIITTFDSCRHVDLVTAGLDSVIVRIEKTFKVKARPDIGIYLVPSSREVVNSPFPIESRAIPENNMLLADLVEMDFSEISQREGLLTRIGRELVHVIVGGSEAYGTDYLYQPLIREGLPAMLYGNGTKTYPDLLEQAKSLLASNALLPLDTMMVQYDSLDTEPRVAYSGCFLRFLHDRYDAGVFELFCRSYQSPAMLAPMLNTVLNSDFETLDKEWRAYLRSN